MLHAARRRARLKARMLVLLLASTALASCTVGSPSSPHAAQAGAAMWLPASTAAGSIRAFLASQGWQRDESPLYTDDQRLHTSATEYGPYVAMYPATTLDTMTNFEPATGGRLVAMIEVTADDPNAALPQTYQDLHLSYGRNCVYLRRNANAAEGYIVATTTICPATNTSATPIPVKPVLSTDFPGAARIPAVARFHEGSNQALNMTDGAPFFGLKCNEAWCQFVPASVVPLLPPQRQDGTDFHHKVDGWGDAQHVAKPNPAAGGTAPALLPSGKTAWIVADTNLGNITRQQFQDDYQRVATVKFKDAPSDKYSSKWSFGRHENEIWIKAGDANLTSWTGYMLRNMEFLGMRMPWKKRTEITVDRDAHPGMVIPATARFRWNPNDEDLWVRCDDGCCKVSEGGIT